MSRNSGFFRNSNLWAVFGVFLISLGFLVLAITKAIIEMSFDCAFLLSILFEKINFALSKGSVEWLTSNTFDSLWLVLLVPVQLVWIPLSFVVDLLWGIFAFVVGILSCIVFFVLQLLYLFAIPLACGVFGVIFTIKNYQEDDPVTVKVVSTVLTSITVVSTVFYFVLAISYM